MQMYFAPVQRSAIGAAVPPEPKTQTLQVPGAATKAIGVAGAAGAGVGALAGFVAFRRPLLGAVVGAAVGAGGMWFAQGNRIPFGAAV